MLEQSTIRVAFKGTYDSQSRTLTMKQTEVLSGEGWSLGEDVGKLSSDGKKLSGSGKDALGGSLGISYRVLIYAETRINADLRSSAYICG